eukprot:TRINITY_DN1478_c0_g1_i13.p1 TRINITY_DN1478_c0_g1~~TRINITY_DN1478_c0_g1_i13.p1  ORF type:complete len:179 (+),score=28.50 TRINITY_DN1478_c0_g1_i13:415-951(+)
MHHAIQARKHEQGEDRRRQDSANHDRRERTLHFSPRAGIQGHRNEAERCDERRHQHRTKPSQRAIDDGLIQTFSLLTQAADEGHHHQSVEHCHAGQSDEPDACRDRERNVTQPKREHAARQCQRNPREDHERIFEIPEGQHEQAENQHQGDRHDDRQAFAGGLQLLEGATEIEPVAGL